MWLGFSVLLLLNNFVMEVGALNRDVDLQVTSVLNEIVHHFLDHLALEYIVDARPL
jgi:hypothetical protein